ncbi:hypothetical protein KC19_1G220700 [Ceratodon purpureus]|uniref:Uncharacterized protein n=1 Tax=Ceratodon purpureus TaxID=3225 RepID=A0A8T0J814_CERPU|nr:hypothetical protein KC19_1G220700 [Ceratodon purpureus]
MLSKYVCGWELMNLRLGFVICAGLQQWDWFGLTGNLLPRELYMEGVSRRLLYVRSEILSLLKSCLGADREGFSHNPVTAGVCKAVGICRAWSSWLMLKSKAWGPTGRL